MATADAPVRPDVAYLSAERTTELIAGAYHDAALARADMRAVVEVMEAIRDGLPGDASADVNPTYGVWRVIEDEIARAAGSRLFAPLCALRRGFEASACASVLERVRAASPDERWEAWLRAYGEAFVSWRHAVCLALADEEVPFPSDAPAREHVRAMTLCAKREEWVEAEPFMRWLADQQSLPPVVRARFHAYCAQVMLYHLIRPEDAVPILEQAEELAPDDWAVVAARGEYWLQKDDIAKSRELFQRSIALSPDWTEAYAVMADSYEREDDLDSAEDWLDQAIQQRPGDTERYLRKIRLLGRPELFAEREKEILAIYERGLAIDREGGYSLHTEVASAYKQNGRYTEAIEVYDRAVAVDPDRPQAYTLKGYAYLESDDVARARLSFRRAIEVAPRYFDGHWGLALAAEQENALDDAIGVLQTALPLRPLWEPTIRAHIGDLQRRLGRHAEAETELLAALRSEPGDQSILQAVYDLLTTTYSPEAPLSTGDARRILEEVRAIEGDSWEASYQNWLGTLSHHERDFDAAIAAYERAIAIEDEDPIFHSNLASAWELRAVPGERERELENAVAAAQRAGEVEPDNPEHGERLSRLVDEQLLCRVLGEDALASAWVQLPLRVELSQELLPLVVDEQEQLSAATIEMIEAMRARIRADCGVPIPGVNFQELSAGSELRAGYQVWIRGIQLDPETVQLDSRFCPGPLEPLVQHVIRAEVRDQALPGAWVSAEQWPAVEAAGIPMWSPIQYVLNQLESAFRAHLDQFVDHQMVATALAQVQGGEQIASSPELLTGLVVALRALVREGVSIAPLDALAREYVVLAGGNVDRVGTVERLRTIAGVRVPLGREVHVLGPELSARVAEAVVDGPPEPFLAFTQDLADEVVAEVRDKVGPGGSCALVVEGAGARPFVRALLEREYPDVQVIGDAERPRGDGG